MNCIFTQKGHIMSKRIILKISALGFRTMFTDTGETLSFKNGKCELNEEQQDSETIAKWLHYNAKACGISQMSDAEIAEMEADAKAEAEKAARVQANQDRVNAIISGVDPQLIPAANTPAVVVQPIAASTNVATSVQQKLAEARIAAAAAAKNK